MRLKEIKPGMVIHCKTQEEKKALLEEAERIGYLWGGNGSNPTKKVYGGNTIHFHAESEFADFKHITWSDKTEGVTEFSDLILPELTAEEAFEWISKHYRDEEWIKCFGRNYCMDEVIQRFGTDNVISKIEQWKSEHEKKEPEIETVDICRIIEIQPDGRKRCVHEEDIKPDPDLPYGSEEIAVHEILKHYCMEHDGEFIAVHEVVSRVKK